MAFETDEGVLFIEVSLIQKCPCGEECINKQMIGTKTCNSFSKDGKYGGCHTLRISGIIIDLCVRCLQ